MASLGSFAALFFAARACVERFGAMVILVSGKQKSPAEPGEASEMNGAGLAVLGPYETLARASGEDSFRYWMGRATHSWTAGDENETRYLLAVIKRSVARI
jgi:hypothetical protein